MCIFLALRRRARGKTSCQNRPFGFPLISQQPCATTAPRRGKSRGGGRMLGLKNILQIKQSKRESLGFSSYLCIR